MKRLLTILCLLSLIGCGNTASSAFALQRGNDTSTNTDILPNTSSDFEVGTGDGAPIAEAISALTLSAQNLYEVFPFALIGGKTQFLDEESNELRTRLFSQSLDCFTAGLIDYSGHFVETTPSSADLDFEIRYHDCDGMNGEYKVIADYSLSGNQTTYTTIKNGTFGANGCLIEMTDLEITYTEESSLGTFSYNYSGEANGSCTNGSFSCRFENTPFQNIASECTEN